MKTAFERLAGFLGQPQHAYKPSTRQYLSLNVDKLKQDLELAERGARRGAREEPPSESSGLDSVECEIVAAIEGHADDAQRAYRENMESYERRLHAQAIETLVSEIRTAFSNANSNFLADVQAGKGELQNLREEVVDSERSYQVFRRSHDLDRPAHYPDSRWLHIGLILLILIGESVLNGVMLARGSEFGLVGGVGSAFMIALVNVLMLGWGLGGAGLRLGHHRRIAPRASGIIILVLAVAGVLLFNLLVAHYRDALAAADPSQAGLEAVARLRENPLGVADAQSWFLFIMGCCFAVAGAFDRLKMDDPYPGYGKVARHRQVMRDDFVSLKREIIERLRAERDDCVDTAMEARREIDKRIRETETILTARQGQHQAFQQHREHLEKVANDLLKVYRESNGGLRKTPAPAHFKDRWSIDQRNAVVLVPQELDVARLRDTARSASDALERTVREVNEAFEKALDSYDDIEHKTMQGADDGKSAQDAA